MDTLFEKSVDSLKQVYVKNYFTDEKMYAKGDSLVFTFPGNDDDDVIVHVHQSEAFTEPFHRHDYYFFKYAYRGSFESLNSLSGDTVRVEEGELYIGQPNACHAIRVHDNLEVIMICFVIRKEAMFQKFLPMLLGYREFCQFLLKPSIDERADECVHLKPQDSGNLIRLIKMIVIECAHAKDDSRAVIESLIHAFLAQVAREATAARVFEGQESWEGDVLGYISQHVESCTLESAARHFSYSPNYFSSIVQRKMGKTFSELLLEQKMQRALMMLEGTNLSVERISQQLGYQTKSGFYKAFREYFGTTPRDYLAKMKSNPA